MVIGDIKGGGITHGTAEERDSPSQVKAVPAHEPRDGLLVYMCPKPSPLFFRCLLNTSSVSVQMGI